MDFKWYKDDSDEYLKYQGILNGSLVIYYNGDNNVTVNSKGG